MSKAERLACADKLEAAALVIQVPGWWTQGEFARVMDGSGCSAWDHRAVQFCMVGAICAAAPDGSDSADMVDAITVFAGCSLSEFNDAPGRTAREVASLMLDAADQLRLGEPNA